MVYVQNKKIILWSNSRLHFHGLFRWWNNEPTKVWGFWGVYHPKFFLNGFAQTGKTAQNESGGGQLAPLAPPPLWRRHCLSL